jgi:PKD repeat protein
VYVVQGIGENFSVEAEVEDIMELQSCVFTIAYNNSLLNATHIARGDFFPQNATFNFEINETAGLVTINMSLLDPSSGLTGNGTLANLTFEVSTRAAESEIGFRTIQLTASGGESIDCLLGGVLLFWWSLDADPDEMGRQIDAYTEGGYFIKGDNVHLLANVTYNRWPVQSQLVGFQVQNGLGENYATLVAVTNDNGTAEVRFTIPPLVSSVGLWTAIGTAQLADRVIWDIVTFTVISHLPHGPKADFTWSPIPTHECSDVQFDASSSNPGWNGTNIAPITEYFWDFGDGNTTTTFTPFVNHTYQEPGFYYVTLTVYAPDATPQTDSRTRIVRVLPCAPAPVGGYTIAPEVVRESAPVTALSLPEFAFLTISLVLAGWKLRKKRWT